jgi:hypothetical protein
MAKQWKVRPFLYNDSHDMLLGVYVVEPFQTDLGKQSYVAKTKEEHQKVEAQNDKVSRTIEAVPDLLELVFDAADKFTDSDMPPPDQKMIDWMSRAFKTLHEIDPIVPIVEYPMNAETVEKDLRRLWTAQGIPKENQDATLLEIEEQVRRREILGPWRLSD